MQFFYGLSQICFGYPLYFNTSGPGFMNVKLITSITTLKCLLKNLTQGSMMFIMLLLCVYLDTDVVLVMLLIELCSFLFAV